MAAEFTVNAQEAWTKPLRQQGILETWGQILGTTSNGLSASQQLTIRQHVLAASSSYPVGFLWAVALGHLSDLAPVVQSIASSSTDGVVQDRAVAVAAPLVPLQAAMSSGALLTLSESWLDGFCQGSTGARHGVCQSLHNDFDNAIKHLGKNANAEQNVLNALIDRATRAASDGNLSPQEASLVLGNATLVRSRL